MWTCGRLAPQFGLHFELCNRSHAQYVYVHTRRAVRRLNGTALAQYTTTGAILDAAWCRFAKPQRQLLCLLQVLAQCATLSVMETRVRSSSSVTIHTCAPCLLPQAANLTVITAAGDVQEVPLPAAFQRLHPLPDAVLLSVSAACHVCTCHVCRCVLGQ